MLKNALVIFCLLISGGAIAQDCGKTPFVIQTAGGVIEVQLPDTLANDTNRPKGRAGLEYARSMYATMGPSVIRQLLTSYTCRVHAAIMKDATKTDAERIIVKNAWDTAVNRIILESTLYFVAFQSSIKDAREIAPTAIPPMDGVEWRSPAQYLTSIPNDNFLIHQSVTGYLNGTFKGITATACGRYLRAALAQNAGQIQNLAAAVKPVLLNYFSDSPFGPRNALAQLFAEAASVTQFLPPTDTAAKNDLTACGAAI